MEMRLDLVCSCELVLEVDDVTLSVELFPAISEPLLH